jgi:hypothetical protein
MPAGQDLRQPSKGAFVAYVHPDDHMGRPAIATKVALAYKQADQKVAIERIDSACPPVGVDL